MANYYYILTSAQYTEHQDNIDKSPLWNLSGSECVVEVDSTYSIPSFSYIFDNNNSVQNYIYDPIRINEWYEPDESELL
jgi:hypothetical protein